MKTWYLWAGLALIALILLSAREGFAATATIKNPNTWDATELSRIKSMVTPTSTISDADIRRVVGGFWSVWDGGTYRLTLAEVATYLSGVSGLGDKRNEYRDLIQAYYIQQGESVFAAASTYTPSTDSGASTPPTPPAMETAEATTEIERPSSATQRLKQEIATTIGVPLADETTINAVIAQVQSFYDTVYLPSKATPTYTQMMGFADGVDTTLLPASVQNNFKIRLVTILQAYFSPGGGAAPADGSSRSAGPADTSAAAGGAEEGSWSATGKNVQGPASGGQGSVDNTTGGLGIPRNYPVLYGGMQSYESALPSSKSLGSDPTAKFLPYSRVPGDQDVYPDPYRLGKYFSTSSYSSKDAPEPAPFLADFSKFFT